MVHIKTPQEIELIRESCKLLSETLAAVASLIKPGMTTLDIDRFAEGYIRDHGAVPSFKNFEGFPYTCCISVNDAVVHGFPNNREIRDGDIISVDVGVFKNGFHGDSAYTFAIGEVSDELRQLLRVTKESLYLGIEKAVAGGRIGDIGAAVQEHTERKYGYGVVRELVGHGLGRGLHEEPNIPNYGKRGSGNKLQAGLVIAIEPMINLGTRNVKHATDGWTILTRDGKPSAHFEHTLAVQKDKADVLSDFTQIEANERSNPALDSSYHTLAAAL